MFPLYRLSPACHLRHYINPRVAKQFIIIGQSLTLADMKQIRERLWRNDCGPRFYIERDGRLLCLYDRIVTRRQK